MIIKALQFKRMCGEATWDVFVNRKRQNNGQGSFGIDGVKSTQSLQRSHFTAVLWPVSQVFIHTDDTTDSLVSKTYIRSLRLWTWTGLSSTKSQTLSLSWPRADMYEMTSFGLNQYFFPRNPISLFKRLLDLQQKSKLTQVLHIESSQKYHTVQQIIAFYERCSFHKK